METEGGGVVGLPWLGWGVGGILGEMCGIPCRISKFPTISMPNRIRSMQNPHPNPIHVPGSDGSWYHMVAFHGTLATHMSPVICYFFTPIHGILHVFHGLPGHPKALPKSPRMPLWWRKIQGTQAGYCFPTICANGSVGHSGFWDGPAFRTRVICRDLQNHHVL